MDQRAILKVESRVRTCQKQIAEMEQCKTYQDFVDSWFTFLTSAKSIYTAFEQGAKISDQSRAWFDAKKFERRGDALLQYIYEARNDEEHGLEPGTEEVLGRLVITSSVPGFSDSVVANYKDGRLKIESRDEKPALVIQVPSTARLKAVRGRNGKLFPPPTAHLGRKLEDDSPYNVAKMAAAYLSGLVEEAKRLS